MAFTIQWKNRGVYVKHSDMITLEDIRMQDDSMYNDERYDSVDYQIIDYLDVTDTNIDDEAINHISAFEFGASIWKKKFKIAFVVKDEFFVELVKIYIEILQRSNWIFKIFDTVQEAEVWCNE